MNTYSKAYRKKSPNRQCENSGFDPIIFAHKAVQHGLVAWVEGGVGGRIEVAFDQNLKAFVSKEDFGLLREKRKRDNVRKNPWSAIRHKRGHGLLVHIALSGAV